MTLRTATTATFRLARGAKAIDSLRLVSAAAAQLHSWAATTEGRCRTGLVLQSLDREVWQVARHIRLPGGGHADHLVTGPTGVYLLNSRAWQGVVTVDHKGATITPDGRPEAAWIARGQHCSLAPAAVALGRTLSAAGSRVPAPRAVVVIWATFPERLALSGGITYVAGDHLVAWLSGQPRPRDHDIPASPTPVTTWTRSGLAPSPEWRDRLPEQAGPASGRRSPTTAAARTDTAGGGSGRAIQPVAGRTR